MRKGAWGFISGRLPKTAIQRLVKIGKIGSIFGVSIAVASPPEIYEFIGMNDGEFVPDNDGVGPLSMAEISRTIKLMDNLPDSGIRHILLSRVQSDTLSNAGRYEFGGIIP